MINLIWMLLIVTGVVVAGVNGRMEEVNQALFSGAQQGVTLSLTLAGFLIFWLGMMKIAEVAGMIQKLGAWMRPLLHRLFPSIPPNHPAMGYIVSNMTANLLGLGNAATPMGIKAMEALQSLNKDQETASPAMCTLVAINTASLTLVPLMVIGVRLQYGSFAATEIVAPAIIATTCSTLVAILVDRHFRRKNWRSP